MELIRQPPESYLCNAACVAMVAGHTLDKVLETIRLTPAPDRSGKDYVKMVDAIRYLLDYDISLGAVARWDNPTLIGDEVSFVSVDAVDAILGVVSHTYENGMHAVVWNASERLIYDPQKDTPQDPAAYELLDWWGVTRHTADD